jgi:hypothetical protein
MARRNMNSTLSYVAAHRGNVPVLRLALGLMLLAFFVLALMMDVQTSEAFILNGGKVAVSALNWAIVSQPFDLFEGHIQDMNMAKAIIVGFDFWTNMNYGTLPSGFGGQLGFASITSFIVAFFGVLGLNLIFGAISDLTR